ARSVDLRRLGLAGPHGAGGPEAEPLLGGGRQVELATRGVGAAVDHARGDRAAAVAKLHAGAAGQRLVRDPDHTVREGATAGEVTAVEAGPVPRRERRAVDGDAAADRAHSRGLGAREHHGAQAIVTGVVRAPLRLEAT